jgi:enterochelin esterase-like enzyme
LSRGARETNGRIETGVIETKLLDKPMRYAVYLPPCYDAAVDENFPVLYLLHGQNYDEEQWIRIGAVDVADRLIRAGESPPFIIVFPYDFSFKQPTQYNFAQVFLELLVPQIDAGYRIRPGAASRAIGGLSRGGAWAIHLGTRHPDVFGAVGAHSPAVFFSDMNTLRLRLRDADHETFPRIYIDVGLQDSEYDSALSFAQLLDEMNIPHEWHAYIGFHEEKYWSAHVEEYLRWYAEGWK